MNLQVITGELANPYLAPALDSQLLQTCRSGDEDAWQNLLGKYEWLVYSVPLRYGLPQEEAADITQIVFTALLQCLDTWCDDSNLSGWLTLVARRHAWRALRCHHRLSSAEANDERFAALFSDRANQNEITPVVLPPIVYDTLMQRFIDYAQFRQQIGLFQRRRAVLTFDTLHEPVPAGVRAGEYDATRHYVYAIDLIDVTLNAQSSWISTRLDLMGQILPNHEDVADNPFVVQLLRHEQEVAITLTDSMGGFWFEALEPGVYGLMLSTDRIEIELPDFAVDL